MTPQRSQISFNWTSLFFKPISHFKMIEQPSPNSDGPILIPGDPERNHIEKCDSLGGIPYHKNVVDYMNNLAVKNDVLPMKFKTLI